MIISLEIKGKKQKIIVIQRKLQHILVQIKIKMAFITRINTYGKRCRIFQKKNQYRKQIPTTINIYIPIIY
jgi:hypothetical protein